MALPKEMTSAEVRRWRFHADTLIQRAIDILDEIDGDPDQEDGADDEPSLGSPAGGESQICWTVGCDDDREEVLA